MEFILQNSKILNSVITEEENDFRQTKDTHELINDHIELADCQRHAYENQALLHEESIL